MNEYKIAKAGMDQMPEVARVFKASRLHALPFLPKLHTQAEDLDYFTKVVFPENEVYVALESQSERVVGFIAFTREWVSHLYLLPEAQARGLGGRLLASAKDRADALDLWTFQKNLAARRFYEKHGFSEVEKTDGSGNEEREPDVRLRWKK